MTKKDYELIARGIAKEVHFIKNQLTNDNLHQDNRTAFEQSLRAITGVAYRLTLDLKQENPKFDREKFLAICGIED